MKLSEERMEQFHATISPAIANRMTVALLVCEASEIGE
jgi:hypothetical protein